MKGQFQLEVLHKVGHAVHEDSPELVAKIFIQIVNRYKFIFNKNE
jgi:pimeloyl-ACP methyl ester carboxylesterase